MIDSTEAEEAFNEAKNSYERDGFKDEEDWLIDKYGKEEAQEIYEAATVRPLTKSFECRDCVGYFEGDYFARRDAGDKLTANSIDENQVSNPPTFPLERLLPMYETNFINVVLDDDSLLSLLSEVGIKGISRVSMTEDRLHRYNRKSAKFDCVTGHDNGSRKVIVDITSTEPSSEQVQNVVYELGADCDERIIVFADFGMNHEGSKRNRDGMQRLVSMMNDYGLRITLVSAIIDEEHFRYSVVVAPTASPKEDITQCPSKERVCEVTFWGMYYWLEGDIFGTQPFPIGLSDGYGHYAWTYGNRNIELKWEDQGAIFSFRGLDESDDYIRAFWGKSEKAIRSAFNGYKIEYIGASGEVPRISIRLLNTPASVLAVASVEEKRAYADLLRAQYDRIRLLIRRLGTDLGSQGLKD